MNLQKEFTSFAKSNGISGLSLHYHKNFMDNMHTQWTGSVTPMVVEDRPVQGTVISVFDRLMMERIIWFAGPVTDGSATITQAQLMFLDSQDSRDVTMYINSPGGSVNAGLSIVDVMDYIKCDVATINVGMAASMGSVLLGAGKKGKRAATRFSRTMLHQSSGGMEGNIQDARVTMAEWERINRTLFELLGKYCDKSPEVVEHDAERDLWLTSEQALEYGIIDDVIA